MSFKLSKAQRWLAIGLAIVIALVLFQQVDEDGLDETPWLIGLLVIGGLLFIAFGSSSSVSPPSKVTVPTASKDIQADFLEAYTRVANFLKLATANIILLEIGEMRSELLKQADEVGLKFAFAIHWLAIARQSPEAQNGPEAKALLHAAAGHLTETIANQLRLEGIREGVRQKAVQNAAKELAEYRVASVQVAKAFAADQAHPMDPLYCLVEKQLPLGHKTPEAREKFYGATIREQWRRLEGRD